MPIRFLFLNGSVRGDQGNTQALLDHARGCLPGDAELQEITLASYTGTVAALAQELVRADALLFGTGVYWSSWGSPLQRFLEVMTSFELTPCFLGKAAGVVVSMDSVGGMDVAHRLQGALSLLGCVLPPLSSVVLSRVGLVAKQHAPQTDVFELEDLRICVENLAILARQPRPDWKTWEIERLPQISGPFPGFGPLAIGLPRVAG